MNGEPVLWFFTVFLRDLPRRDEILLLRRICILYRKAGYMQFVSLFLYRLLVFGCVVDILYHSLAAMSSFCPKCALYYFYFCDHVTEYFSETVYNNSVR